MIKVCLISRMVRKAISTAAVLLYHAAMRRSLEGASA